jgi:hypothetical protein
MQQLTHHRTGKESPAYLNPEISMRTNLQAASNRKDVVAYFVKSMRHYSDKEILVIPFNTGNPSNFYKIRPGLVVTLQGRQIQ